MRLTQFTAADRVRAFGHVIIAGIYFYIAQSISVHAAHGLASDAWAPLVERSILLFLLVVGFAAMGRAILDGARDDNDLARRALASPDADSNKERLPSASQ